MNIDKLIFNFEDVMEPITYDEFVLDVEMKKKNYDYSFIKEQYEILRFYNDELLPFMEQSKSCLPDIFKSEAVKSYVSGLHNSQRKLKYLSILIYLNVITTCGAGYVFDNSPLKMSEEQRILLQLAFWGKYVN